MAIRFVGKTWDNHRGSFTGMARQPPNGVTWSHNINSGLVDGIRDHVRTGDLVIAIMGCTTNNYSPAPLIVRDPSGTDYNELTRIYSVQASVSKAHMKIGWKFMGSSADDTIWMGQSNDGLAGICHIVYVFEGVDPTTPFDGLAPVTNIAFGPGVNPPGITPATPESFIVSVGVAGGCPGATRLIQAGDMSYQNSWYAGEIYKPSVGFGHYSDWTSGVYNPGPWTLSPTDTADRTSVSATFALRAEGATTGGTGGGAKVWNGTAWVTKPVKYWNGTSFVTKPLKRWNGTAWITTP